MLSNLFRLSALALALATSPLIAADVTPPAGEIPPVAEVPAEGAAKPFPLTFCVTCGDDFTGAMKETIVTKTHKGREVKLCKGCVKIYNADPDGYLKQVDKSIKTGKPVREGH